MKGNKLIQFTLNQYPMWRIDTQFMRNYNYVFFDLGKVAIVIGRPIIPWINKGIDLWQESRLNKIRLYYLACKEQVDYSIHTDLSEVRKDWMIQTTIMEMERSVPMWLKRFISNHMEKYYEREFKKYIIEKCTDEEITC